MRFSGINLKILIRASKVTQIQIINIIINNTYTALRVRYCPMRLHTLMHVSLLITTMQPHLSKMSRAIWKRVIVAEWVPPW